MERELLRGDCSNLVHRVKLLATQKLVLHSLHNFRGDNAAAWPSNRRIMETTGLRETAVRMAVRSLCELGVLRVQHRFNCSSMYFIDYRILDQMVAAQPQESDPKSPAPNDTPVSLSDTPPSLPDTPPSPNDTPPSPNDTPPLATRRLTTHGTTHGTTQGRETGRARLRSYEPPNEAIDAIVAIYPKRSALKGGRAAVAAEIESGTDPRELLEAVGAYAIATEGADAARLPSLENFIRQGKKDDDRTLWKGEGRKFGEVAAPVETPAQYAARLCAKLEKSA